MREIKEQKRRTLLLGLPLLIFVQLLLLANQTHAQADYTACGLYLNGIIDDLNANNLQNVPASFQLTLLYSGRQINDEGDVEACRDSDEMAFVRFSTDTSINIPMYKGLCMTQICNADVLNDNKVQACADITNLFTALGSFIKRLLPNQLTRQQKQLLEGWHTPQATTLPRGNNLANLGAAAISPDDISFVPYQDSNPSVSAGLIIAFLSIGACVLTALVTPVMKTLADRKKKNRAGVQDETRYETLINYNQHGANSIMNAGSAISTMNKSATGQIVSPTVSWTGAATTAGGNPSAAATAAGRNPSALQNSTSQISPAMSATAATVPSTKPRRVPLYIRCAQCWNVVENVSKMFTLKSNNDDLLVFNGLRSLCFIQVIFGHEFYLHMNYMSNPADLMIEQKKPFILFLFSCLYSVDVFFWLGGFFLAYVVADEKQARNFNMKKPVKVLISFFFAIVNRVFRILPCYFVVLMFYWKISPFLGASPTWDIYNNQAANCDARWWQNLLFIDNMFPGQHEKCFGWGWYLSNDFQMFIAGMILLIVYQNNRLIGKISIMVSFAAVQFVSIYLSYDWNFKVPMNIVNLGAQHYYDGYYTKPWTRSPPYFIGLFLGILYKEYQIDKAKSTRRSLLMFFKKALAHTWKKYISYGIGMFFIFGLMFGPRTLQTQGLDYWPDYIQNFWFGTCRTFYVIGVSFLVLPGICGSKDLIVQFFNCKLFAFLQRLSFGGYLTHYIIILFTIYEFQDAVYYNVENLLTLFFTEFAFTLVAAATVALVIEIPIMNLSGILLGGRKPSSAAAPAHPPQLQRLKLEDLAEEHSPPLSPEINATKSQNGGDNDKSDISSNNKSITVHSRQKV